MTDSAPTAISRKPTFLREWRKFRLLSQETASARLGIKQGTLSKIERGELPYNQDFLEQAALAYGCDAADLLWVNPAEPRETEVIRLFRKASAEQRRIIAAVLKVDDLEPAPVPALRARRK